MKRAYVIAAIAASLAGTAMHFLYDVSPNLISALLAPVNESVWEHLKLLFWPTLGAAAVLSTRSACKLRLWYGFLAAILAMPAFLLGAYFLLKKLGASGLAVDIALYYAAMLAGFAFAWQLQKRRSMPKHTGILLMLVMLYGSALVLFTFAAPALPIFQPPA